PYQLDELNRLATASSGEFPPMPHPGVDPDQPLASPAEFFAQAAPGPEYAQIQHPASTFPGVAPPPPRQSGPRYATQPTRGRSRWPWVVFTVLVLRGVGAVVWFAYLQLQHKPAAKVATGSASAEGSEAVAVTGSGSA